MNMTQSSSFDQVFTAKCKAEEDLRHSEERYRALIENITDPIWSIDRHCNLTLFNSHYSEQHRLIFGTDVKIGMNMRELLPVKVYELLKPLFMRALSGERLKKEYSFSTEGSTLYYELFFNPVLYGNIVESVSVLARNITHVKKADLLKDISHNISEKANQIADLPDLGASIHNEVSRLVNAPGFLLSLYDPEGKILSFPYVADTVQEAGFYSPQKLGKGLIYSVLSTGKSQVFSKNEIIEINRTALKKYPAKKIPSSWMGLPLKAGDRTVGVMSIFSYDDDTLCAAEDQRFIHFIANQVSTIIERQRTREALSKSEAYFRSLIENSLDIIIVVNEGGIITFISNSVERMLGYTVAEATGARLRDIFSSLENLLPGSSKGETNVVPAKYREFQVMHKDGTIRILEVIGNDLHSDPSVRGVVINAHDITRRRRYENMLKQISGQVSGDTGRVFFSRLVKKLSQALGGDYVMVAEFDTDQENLDVFAFYGNGKRLGRAAYPVKNTPFEEVLRTGSCISKGDVQELFPGDEMLERLNARTFAGTVLNDSEGNAIGALAVLSKDDMKDVGVRRSLITLFGSRASGELERLRSVKRLEVLHSMDKAILESRSIKEISDVALKNISWFVSRFDYASVCIFDFKKEEAHFISACLKYKSLLAGGKNLPLNAFRSFNNLKKGKPVIVRDILKSRTLKPVEEILAKEGVRSYMIYPLISRGELIGALKIASKVPSAYKTFDFKGISELANQLALALHDLKQNMALRHSEQRNRSILNAIPDIMYHFDSKGTFIGYKGEPDSLPVHPAKFMGRTVRDVYGKVFGGEMLKCIRKAIRSKDVQLMEFESVANEKKGSLFYEARFISGIHDDVLCLVRDITQRKQSEEELQLFNSVVRSTSDGIVITDPTLKNNPLIYANPAFYQISGYGQDEVLGKNFKLLWGADTNTEVINALKRAFLAGAYFEGEMLNYKKDGTPFWNHLTLSPIYSSEKKLMHFVGIIKDVTSRKESEQLLVEKNHEMNNFVYKASHDLKGPLASIIGITNLALTEVKDEYALKFVKFVNESTQRLNSILQELLEISRVTHSTVQAEKVNLRKLVEEIINSLQHAEHSRNVEFAVEVKGKEHLRTDPKILTSVIQNLIDNAIKYKNERTGRPFVHVSIDDYKYGVMIEIKDNGVGIPDKLQGKVFDMFFRGSERSNGTGLGLYIVKNSIKKLGGLVDFYSKEMEGSSFNIYLPDLRNKKNLPTKSI